MATSRTYIAAVIPCSLRQKCLWYIQRKDIIGTISSENKFAGSTHYDVIIFTPEGYERARRLLSTPTPQQSSFEDAEETPVFIPQITVSVDVPDSAADPEQYARIHFMKHFSLTY